MANFSENGTFMETVNSIYFFFSFFSKMGQSILSLLKLFVAWTFILLIKRRWPIFISSSIKLNMRDFFINSNSLKIKEYIFKRKLFVKHCFLRTTAIFPSRSWLGEDWLILIDINKKKQKKLVFLFVCLLKLRA